jgi:hypothetical protein
VPQNFKFFFFFFFATSQFDWPIAKRKLKIRRFSKTEDSIERWSASSLWWVKYMGLKQTCYWEHPWGTHWELEGNMLGTNGKMEKWKKKKKDWKVHGLQQQAHINDVSSRK